MFESLKLSHSHSLHSVKSLLPATAKQVQTHEQK